MAILDFLFSFLKDQKGVSSEGREEGTGYLFCISAVFSLLNSLKIFGLRLSGKLV